MMGIDVHDPADYPAVLKPGMVFTIEPGVYIPEEKIGVRIECDFLVGEDGKLIDWSRTAAYRRRCGSGDAERNKVKMDPRDEADPAQLEALASVFREQLLACLEECAQGSQGTVFSFR